MQRNGSKLFYLLPLFFVSFVSAQVKYLLLKPDPIKTRLNLYKGNDSDREASLAKVFADAGCTPANLSEQIVPKRKQPNVICVLPGNTPDVIVVGAHFDHVSEGSGIIDNWSGAALLPSLFESLAGTQRNHTFVFVGFTGEEAGEVGSAFYVKQLPKDQLSHIQLMVNLDTLGLGPTKVWVSRSDKAAVEILGATARTINLPVARVDVDGFGESDEEPFRKLKLCTITVHSITQETAHVLHKSADSPSAVRFDDYYDTYRLLAAYLTMLDTQLDAEHSDCHAKSK